MSGIAQPNTNQARPQCSLHPAECTKCWMEQTALQQGYSYIVTKSGLKIMVMLEERSGHMTGLIPLAALMCSLIMLRPKGLLGVSNGKAEHLERMKRHMHVNFSYVCR